MNKTHSVFSKFSIFLKSAAVITLSTLFIVTVVYAATIIGSDISTGGNLTVTGVTVTGRASSTSATTTSYLYVGYDITEPAGWDFESGDLIVADDAFINGQATTSASLWVGSAGTANNLDLAGGDLYVQGDAEFDGKTYLAAATTTDSLAVGGYASTTGKLVVSGGSLSLATGTATTTRGLFVGPTAGTGTTTLGVGSENQNGCIELGKNGVYYRVYINETGIALVVAPGRCKD